MLEFHRIFFLKKEKKLGDSTVRKGEKEGNAHTMDGVWMDRWTDAKAGA
jgi:hypothetical protein